MRLMRMGLTAWILLPLLLMLPTQATSDFDSLRAAILAANSEGIGTIALDADIKLTADLPPITGAVTVDGRGHSINGDKQFRIFDVNGGALALSNLTLSEGKASHGGAIQLRKGARVKIAKSAFKHNEAERGGAISMASDGDRLTVDSSSFELNLGADYAGAIYADRGAVVIENSSFTGNRSVIAGAIHSYSRSLTISNSTFSGNHGGGGGGALDLNSGTATLTHLTIVNNNSGLGSGGAIFHTGGKVYLRNSIIGDNGESDDCNGGLDQNRGNLSLDGSCGIRASDAPRLGALTGSPAYHPLLDGSHAIDAADPEFCAARDQVGTARPRGAGCDIGAIESIDAIAAAPTQVPPVACTLSYQIIAANTDKPAGGCPAGDGADKISLTRDTVLFAALPAITSAITIEGNGHSINGNRQFRIFDVDGGQLTINNLTLAEGRASDNGGAIKVQNGGQAIIFGSTFIKNRAENGGAIATKYPSIGVTITGSSFVGNFASWDGGAIVKLGGNLRISQSSFVNNAAGIGGGAIQTSSAGKVDVSNSTFISNRASRGGAIQATGAITTLTHVTMLGNSTGVWVYDDRRTLNLRNSIIAGSKRGVDCRGPLTQNINNFIADGSCAPMLQGEPMLDEPSDDSTFIAPLPGSPVIGAAHISFCPPHDQLGNARPQVGGCDIGAIEVPPVISDINGCLVKTTHGLNFRDSPAGQRIGTAPENAILGASARTPAWFKVELNGQSGWISADYVVTLGDCD